MLVHYSGGAVCLLSTVGVHVRQRPGNLMKIFIDSQPIPLYFSLRRLPRSDQLWVDAGSRRHIEPCNGENLIWISRPKIFESSLASYLSEPADLFGITRIRVQSRCHPKSGALAQARTNSRYASFSCRITTAIVASLLFRDAPVQAKSRSSCCIHQARFSFMFSMHFR